MCGCGGDLDGEVFGVKEMPRPPLGRPGPGAVQTARKPNFVLDDHSSTRRITTAL